MSAVAQENPRSPWARLHTPPPTSGAVLIPSSRTRAWRPPTLSQDPPAAPAPQRERASLSLSTCVFPFYRCSSHAGFVSLCIRLSILRPSVRLSSLPGSGLSLLPHPRECCSVVLCLLFIFFLVRRKDIFFLTVENVKAESEEEPCGESGGLSETGCGPRVQADLGLGAAGGGGLPRPQPQNTTDPQGPSLPVDAASRPHSFSRPVPQSVPAPRG